MPAPKINMASKKRIISPLAERTVNIQYRKAFHEVKIIPQVKTSINRVFLREIILHPHNRYIWLFYFRVALLMVLHKISYNDKIIHILL